MRKNVALMLAVFMLLSVVPAFAESANSYVTFDLPYNKDVFESVSRYRAQFKDEQGNYVKDYAGRFEYQVEDAWWFNAYVYGNYALDEDTFAENMSVDLETNKATINGVPFQFGKIKSEIDGYINESNVLSADVKPSVTIEVPDNYYSKIHTALWSYTDRAEISVTYKYADKTSSTEKNITKVAGGKTMVSNIVDGIYYKTMTNGGKASVLCCSQYNPYYDTDEPGSGFKIAIVDHILTPDKRKVLDKIEIEFKNHNMVLFAMTGEITDCETLESVLVEEISQEENTSLEKMENTVKVCEIILKNLDDNGYIYDAEYKQAFETLKDELINRKIALFEASAGNLSKPYTGEQKEAVAVAEKYYEQLQEWDISLELVDEQLIERYNNIYEAYKTAMLLEKEIARFNGSYDWTRYDELLELADKVEKQDKAVLDSYHKEIFDELCVAVYRARSLDEEISKLSDVYDVSMKETVCDLFARYCDYYATTCGDRWFFEFCERLTQLYAQTGMCGEKAMWEIDEGCLYISGDGEMLDFIYPDNAPWYERRNEITKIVLPREIGKIGKGAFEECNCLRTVCYFNTPEKWNEINTQELSENINIVFVPNIELMLKQTEAGLRTTVGFYNIAEECKVVAVEEKTIKVYDRATAEEGLELSGETKIMVWESIANIKPLCEVQKIK